MSHTFLNKHEVEQVMAGRHYDPFRVLGLHPLGGNDWVIQAWLPDVREAEVILPSGRRYPMRRTLEAGFFQVRVPEEPDLGRYLLRTVFHDGSELTRRDPYSFWPLLGDFDLALLQAGDHHYAYEKLGAHIREVDGVTGVHFAVWAPHAERVSVVGHFNGWNGLRHPMRNMGSSGVWELFIPGLGHGELYRFEIRTRRGELLLKSDPYGRCMEMRPSTASIVWDIEGFEWTDAEYLARRRSDARDQPISVYEVHLGSWARGENGSFLNYRELAHRIADYVTDLGFTHVELLPITEHPFDGSWGYQVTGYFAPTSRFGTPQDFMYFVNHLHSRGIGVIIDWVPGHFPKDPSGLAYFDGQALYEYADPRKGEHQDWGTHIFDYGRAEVVNFLLASANFWLDKYHVDGLRVDAVASMLYLDFSRKPGEWVPNQYGGNENLEAIAFLKRLNELTHRYFPGVLNMAEESSSFPGVSSPVFAGGLGFDFKWGMGWMNDSLAYFEKDPIYRKYEHHKISFFMVYAYSENYILPISHDEVVHGKRSMIEKMPGDVWQKFAGLRAFLGYQWTMPGKKLLFMGQEFGQWKEWQYAESLEWNLLDFPSHRGVQRLVADLNRLYRSERALHAADNIPGGFEWLVSDDADRSVYAYLRRDPASGEFVVVICNFTPVQYDRYRLGVPEGGAYLEVLNSDAELYWGGNKGNLGEVWASDQPSHGRPFSLEVLLPAYGVLVFKPRR
ncbi:1,4-alpha-glucan branching enzyme [Deinobacterium chartae]|uniref:1,4-alpha-glucan branching enzyme GlgB n=1 Tax=Deinobacterium chartae TaxID=521158 RepID=A0A841I4B0_9DEIO|nr:1,4-alpha-glucan branching protein GlgB [Deinobacterium chartae]MBB6099238.1 1,4-alpha-glucan branching enzyme [Deinobacterium chartae]